MKTLRNLFFVALLSATAGFVNAQGTVNFANSTATKIYYWNGNDDLPVPTGNPNPNFVAALYWGPEGSTRDSLTEVARTQTWQPFTGVFSGGTLSLPVAPGTRVTLQVRAWIVGCPYEPTYGPLQLITLGGAGTPPGAPASLAHPVVAGDTPFTGFTIVCIPEPSSVVLVFVGLGVIMLLRQRKLLRT